MEIIKIFLKLFNSLRLDYSKITYSKKVENGYNESDSIKNLVIYSEVEVIDPRNLEPKKIIEIPFSSEKELDSYIDSLDNLTNKDLVFVYSPKQTPPTNSLKYIKVVLNVTYNGQNVFSVPSTILTFDTLLFVNGVKQKHPEDYIISDTSITFLNRHFELSISDEVEVYYVSA